MARSHFLPRNPPSPLSRTSSQQVSTVLAAVSPHQTRQYSLARTRMHDATSPGVSNDVERKRKVSDSCVWLTTVQTWVSGKAPPVVLKDPMTISATLQVLEGLSHAEKTERRDAKLQCVSIESLEELLDFSRVLGAGAV